ncbi:hypothetical protein MKW94_028835 [Papaver nudicaule]|uniref:Cytochrome b5 heme-binding domain-containing protein n=1 Tax=Papaver nudicaule TaxID=74823 RepID=A0AA42AWS3_PAPNU|nr:hypothetical protein [Papaver nudicaule]
MSRSLLFLSFAFSITLFGFFLCQYSPPPQHQILNLWRTEDLALYNGTYDDESPILLSVLGSVFDVTNGRSHYGPGGNYHHFVGKDASRAFASGNFTGDGLTDSLHGLSSLEVKSVVDWRDFYSRRYIYAGKPTMYLKGVEAKAAIGAQLLEKQRKEEAKLPDCNSRWSQQEGAEKPLEIALTGKMRRRCACFKDEELAEPGLELYQDCDYLSKVCRVG